MGNLLKAFSRCVCAVHFWAGTGLAGWRPLREKSRPLLGLPLKPQTTICALSRSR